MDQIKTWARGELKKHIPYLEDDDIGQMLENLMGKDAASINQELSNLMDFTQREVKKFINEFIERLEYQRQYEEQVKVVQAKTLKKKKEEGGGTQKATKQIKDVSKFLVPGRTICYCQCTRHNLINNCTNCGKIVCEQEGEGPCLFCGAWVDRENEYDVGEDQDAYYVALQHRDKLIEFDVNAAQRLGVLDAQSDWYDMANNTWLNKEQREYAKQMQVIEKKRQDDIDSKMNVTIDLVKGTTDLKLNEEDKLFAFGSQNKMVNEFMNRDKQEQRITQAKPKLFKPFENEEHLTQYEEDPMKQLEQINSFYFKPCTLRDESHQQLYNEMKPEYKKAIEDRPVNTKKQQFEFNQGKKEETKQEEILAKAKQKFIESSLSLRLQSENPFDEFKKAVETAVKEKALKKTKAFEGDKDFYKESDDIGMCLSMHQPWASLLVYGFKRFEGREWTHKYRGPIWIHSTSQKPSQELIDQLESTYQEFYKEAKEDMPEFPERYPISMLLGRVDLIDIITLDEYHDTVPQKLQEPTESQYQFICRNPMYLELPQKMSGQPGIYKIEKPLFYGVKDLLKKVPYTWWPPQVYRLYQLGRFDLYPMQFAGQNKETIMKMVSAGQQQQLKIDVIKTNLGCFHIKNLLSVKDQQAILEGIRQQSITEPQKYKFSRSEVLAEEEAAAREEDTFDYMDTTQATKGRSAHKFNCYVMTLGGKDVSEELKHLPQVIEEGVNQIKDTSAAGGLHSKTLYKRFTFDFFKEQSGYMDKITLSLPHAKGKKKGGNKLVISSFLVAIGDSVRLDYTIDEENRSYNYTLMMNSGDAFVVNSEVKGMQYSVQEVKEGSKPKELIMREGSLLLTVERE